MDAARRFAHGEITRQELAAARAAAWDVACAAAGDAAWAAAWATARAAAWDAARAAAWAAAWDAARDAARDAAYQRLTLYLTGADLPPVAPLYGVAS